MPRTMTHPGTLTHPDTPHREITHRTTGTQQGPITRLMSPGDLGEVLKPFIFLDIFSLGANNGGKGFGMHPHSGIATVTFMVEGDIAYEDTTGAAGVLPAGGVEWMRAGNGVWHTASPAGTSPMLGFQLWVALPPELENAPASSAYLTPSEIPRLGPARVLLGEHEGVQSPVDAPSGLTYLAITLKDGEHWRYTPPQGHNVAWVAVATGRLNAGDGGNAGERVDAGELTVFAESEQPIDFIAHGDTTFVLGSAIKHPHDLVSGYYSVHTSEAALAQGEAEIARIGAQLRKDGRLG